MNSAPQWEVPPAPPALCVPPCPPRTDPTLAPLVPPPGAPFANALTELLVEPAPPPPPAVTKSVATPLTRIAERPPPEAYPPAQLEILPP